jgi:glyoxylase-like metal-dependent hydrolase (beta-lactamase superfamily II)
VNEVRGRTYEVLAVRYGTRETVKSEVFLNFHVYGEPDAPILMDYFFWLLRNEERTVMVDCGFDPAVGERRGRRVLCPPVEALARLGTSPDAVDLIVVTHAHYDHIGNLAAFPSTPLLASATEVGFWTGPLGRRAQFATSAEAPEIDALRAAQAQGRVTTFAGRAEPFPGIEVVEIGGHTPGQALVVVDVAGGRQVVLASDSSHYYEEHELDRPFAFVADLPAMYRGFDLLNEMAAAPERVVVPGHDPEVMSRFEPCAGDLAGLAVRLG